MSMKRIRLRDIQQAKEQGRIWAMLTCYDYTTAQIFDEAGIEVLLVGDSAANTVYGYPTTLEITLDELIPLVRAVSRGARRALVVGDLPFGSYEASDEHAVTSAVALCKNGAQAVKLEGGADIAERVTAITRAGIAVFGHVGFTPQRVHSLSGYRVQGKAESRAAVIADAHAVVAAGAVAVVLEMVPADVAATVQAELPVPVIGIGAGNHCDAQVLVWQDMAGLSAAAPSFVATYASLRDDLSQAASAFAASVARGTFPADEHSF